MNAKDSIGTTALMHAAKYGSNDIVQILLNGGADINVKSKKGTTALSLATKNDYTELVELLREAGAEK